TNWVGDFSLLTAMTMPTLSPLTVEPLSWLVIEAISGPGGGGKGSAVPQVAPETFTGDVASLLMVTAAETAQLPDVSVATACTWYAAAASEPVTHVTDPLQLVPEHGIVPNTVPLPHSLMSTTPLGSLAVAATTMLPPVHALLAGLVMLPVGPVSSPFSLRTKAS